MPLSNREFVMASNQLNNRIKACLGVSIFLAVSTSLSFKLIFSVAHSNEKTNLPSFDSFVQSVQDGQRNVLRGVYVPGEFALPVIQQPTNDWYYVSSASNQLTQYSMASDTGNIGLLAHNNLAGEWFDKLTPSQEVRLIYGDGNVEYFNVSEVIRFQALEPNDIYSDFLDLGTGTKITSSEVFNQVYRGERHVTFQTCIAANGNVSWGRLFVIAETSKIVAAN